MSVVQIWVGIDVSKSRFDVCVLSHGSPMKARFDNDQDGFCKLLSSLGIEPVHVCLERTGGYERSLVEFLVDAGIRVSRADSLLVRRFVQGMGILHKTDRIDATLLAKFCRLREPAPVEMEPRATRELRQLVRALLDLKVQRRQLRNRIVGPSLGSAALPAMEMASKGIEAAIAELERLLERLLEQEPQLRAQVELLSSIPGIAKTAALKILAFLPEGTLRSARGLAAYAGLVPGLRESGLTKRTSGIGLRCNRALRAILFMAGLVARRCCPHLKAFALSLVARGKAKKQAIVAVARKLTHAIFAVLMSKEPYSGEKLCAST
jgi:transposase